MFLILVLQFYKINKLINIIVFIEFLSCTCVVFLFISIFICFLKQFLLIIYSHQIENKERKHFEMDLLKIEQKI